MGEDGERSALLFLRMEIYCVKAPGRRAASTGTASCSDGRSVDACRPCAPRRMEKLRSQLAEAAAKAKEEAAYVFSEELAKARELKAASVKLKEAASSSIDSAKQRVASNVGLNEGAGPSLGALLLH